MEFLFAFLAFLKAVLGIVQKLFDKSDAAKFGTLEQTAGIIKKNVVRDALLYTNFFFPQYQHLGQPNANPLYMVLRALLKISAINKKVRTEKDMRDRDDAFAVLESLLKNEPPTRDKKLEEQGQDTLRTKINIGFFLPTRSSMPVSGGYIRFLKMDRATLRESVNLFSRYLDTPVSQVPVSLPVPKKIQLFMAIGGIRPKNPTGRSLVFTTWREGSYHEYYVGTQITVREGIKRAWNRITAA